MSIIRNYTPEDIHRIIDQGIDPESPIAFFCQLVALTSTGLNKKFDATTQADLCKCRTLAEMRLTGLLITEGWNLRDLSAPSSQHQGQP